MTHHNFVLLAYLVAAGIFSLAFLNLWRQDHALTRQETKLNQNDA